MVHAPRGRDAEVVQGVLAARGLTAVVCRSQEELLAGLEEGSMAAIMTEDVFVAPPGVALGRWLMQQPSWSDFPFIVLTSRQTSRRSEESQAWLRVLSNVVVLERPVHADTLASAAMAAVRARKRQYATRQNLEELRDARATVELLNRELEDRIVARTRELASANDRLMTEIAERERVQAVLAHGQKMEAIGRLTGGIAHDFNNLLHVVSMNLELLCFMAPEPRVAALAEQAKRAVGRGARLTGQLLSFARAQSLVLRLTDVKALLLGMQDLVAVSLGAGIRLRLALCDSPAWARIDASQLEMAVLNLAVNAKDAMGNKGSLLMEVCLNDGPESGLAPGRYIMITVADDGPGVPAPVLSKVFDPFFTTKPVGSGTGLGLSQVYGFAQQSGGTARIHNAPEGGAIVDIYLPLADEPAAQTTPDALEDQVPSAGSYRILVIEDDADVRRVIVESLVFAGHTVVSAASGKEGLTALMHYMPDLLIVDYAMPGMNGAEVITRVRALAPDLPVILATGYADMGEIDRILDAQSVLIKPFNLAALQVAVTQAMQPRSAGAD